MQRGRTREMYRQPKVTFKSKFIISNRSVTKARDLRLFTSSNDRLIGTNKIRTKNIICLVNGPSIPEEGLEFRMGLTFWSDRLFQSNEMNAGQYHCALPLTSISKITTSMISKAFTSISRMHGGGDAEEDVLLGKPFGIIKLEIFFQL